MKVPTKQSKADALHAIWARKKGAKQLVQSPVSDHVAVHYASFASVAFATVMQKRSWFPPQAMGDYFMGRETEKGGDGEGIVLAHG